MILGTFGLEHGGVAAMAIDAAEDDALTLVHRR